MIFLDFVVARDFVTKKYHQMGYDRARDVIILFSKAEIISLGTRTSLMEYLNTIDTMEREYKRKKRKLNKEKRRQEKEKGKK